MGKKDPWRWPFWPLNSSMKCPSCSLRHARKTHGTLPRTLYHLWRQRTFLCSNFTFSSARPISWLQVGSPLASTGDALFLPFKVGSGQPSGHGYFLFRGSSRFFDYFPDPSSFEFAQTERHGKGITLTWNPREYEYYLPSRAEASILPPPLLTECSVIWLRTLDYLESSVSFTPQSRASLRTLRPFTYDNVVSAWPVRPALLAGHAASQYLSSVILGPAPLSIASFCHLGKLDLCHPAWLVCMIPELIRMSLLHANTLGGDSGDMDSRQSALVYFFWLRGSYYIAIINPKRYVFFPGLHFSQGLLNSLVNDLRLDFQLVLAGWRANRPLSQALSAQKVIHVPALRTSLRPSDIGSS